MCLRPNYAINPQQKLHKPVPLSSPGCHLGKAVVMPRIFSEEHLMPSSINISEIQVYQGKQAMLSVFVHQTHDSGFAEDAVLHKRVKLASTYTNNNITLQLCLSLSTTRSVCMGKRR
jgi:hypothetical protein